jgi:hypothetical protein
VRDLLKPVGLHALQQAAWFLLDTEKPAHTYSQLRVRAHSMQLAPPSVDEIAGGVDAQLGNTTLLWDEPWVFDSDC